MPLVVVEGVRDRSFPNQAPPTIFPKEKLIHGLSIRAENVSIRHEVFHHGNTSTIRTDYPKRFFVKKSKS